MTNREFGAKLLTRIVLPDLAGIEEDRNCLHPRFRFQITDGSGCHAARQESKISLTRGVALGSGYPLWPGPLEDVRRKTLQDVRQNVKKQWRPPMVLYMAKSSISCRDLATDPNAYLSSASSRTIRNAFWLVSKLQSCASNSALTRSTKSSPRSLPRGLATKTRLHELQ